MHSIFLFEQQKKLSKLLSLLFILVSLLPAHVLAGKVKNKTTGTIFNDLQAAIDTANSGDTLLLKGTFVTNTGFIINKSLNLKGKNEKPATLDGNRLTTVLTVNETIPNTVFVKLNHLKIQNGLGGSGGGINNNATLTLQKSIVTQNHAFSGAGIFNFIDENENGLTAGNLTIIHSTISHNVSDNSAGGILNLGSFSKQALLTIQNSKISHNSSNSNGGAICNILSQLFMINSKITNNEAYDGGGLYNESSIAVLSEIEMKSNLAKHSGGGIFNYNLGIEGSLSVIAINSSKISHNTATLEGGGLYNLAATATLIQSTIKHNTAANGGGILNGADSHLTLTDTLIKDNSPNDVVDL